MNKTDLKKKIIEEFEDYMNPEMVELGMASKNIMAIDWKPKNIEDLEGFILSVIDQTFKSIEGKLVLEETFGNVYQHEAKQEIKQQLSDWNK